MRKDDENQDGGSKESEDVKGSNKGGQTLMIVTSKDSFQAGRTFLTQQKQQTLEACSSAQTMAEGTLKVQASASAQTLIEEEKLIEAGDFGFDEEDEGKEEDNSLSRKISQA